MSSNTMTDELLPVSQFRRALPQFLAVTAKNLLFLELAMSMAFTTLVIPEVLNSKSEISFDTVGASWFGSIAYIFQPLGSLLSGITTEPLGRKCSMILVNIPYLIAWYLYYSAYSTAVIFLAAALIGLGIGFMEAPVITYVGEISDPNLRGMLTSYTSLFLSLGFTFQLILGSLYNWTTVALINSSIPLITIIAIWQIPETPMWLLSKGRKKEAEKSLCWLRGWVSEMYVQNEMNDLIRYINNSRRIVVQRPEKQNLYCDKLNHHENSLLRFIGYDNEKSQVDSKNNYSITNSTIDSADMSIEIPDIGIESKPKLIEKICDFFRPQMLKPLIFVIFFFMFHYGSGYSALRSYMIIIFKELKIPQEPHKATIVVSCVGFIGVLVCILSVKYTGKRILTLVSLTGCAISLISLSISSYTDKDSINNLSSWLSYLLFLFYVLSYCSGLGTLPWVILSEVFPFRGRGFVCGVAAAIAYIIGFVVNKTFFNLYSLLGLSGVFGFYGSIMIIGIIFIYFQLPETEGKTLQSIENFYKEKSENT